MIFQDNVIKEYLKNIYFISGTPCGGKTTLSRELYCATKDSGYYWMERTPESTVDETVEKVSRHFGF